MAVAPKMTQPTKRDQLRLEGGIIVQRGTLMFVGGQTAREVVAHAKVDTYDPKTGHGYQRELSESRVHQAASFYANGGRMPNPLLLNIRQDDVDNIRVEVHGDRAAFQRAMKNSGSWIGMGAIEGPNDLVEWLFDGQHRKSALEENVVEDPKLGDFPVPVVLTLGLSGNDEMIEFYEVNSNAKSVKTDLAWTLLRRRAQDDPELAQILEVEGKDWITKGQDVVEELGKLPGPWKNSIQMPNEKRVRSDRFTITQAQFVRSLKAVLNMPLMSKADAKVVAQVLNAYWKGIAQVLPEPFERSNNPKDWVIQKGPGAIAFHRVLPQIIEVLRARGQRLGDAQEYAKVLKDLVNLSDSIVTEDGDARTVSGADFWRSGPEGVASQFTGDAGRKRLAIRVQTLLPRPTEALVL